MTRKDWRELLLPDEEERDLEFRAQTEQLSVFGLRVIAAVCAFGAIYFVLVALAVPEGLAIQAGGASLPLSILALGAAAFGLSYVPVAQPHARWAGVGVGYGVALVQFVALASFVDRPELSYFLISGLVTGVMLVGTAALPLKPVHTLALGIAIGLTYTALLPRAAPQLAGHRAVGLLYVAQVVLLCVALTAIVYHQRVVAYRARRSAHQALEQLRAAQARVLVSENAHSQSRFAAALSHELNTPLGALTSAFDTILHVLRKEDIASSPRYREILSGAEAAGRGSAARLQQIIERMSLLTNLDRADTQSVDLSELCRETAAHLRQELTAKGELHLDLVELPALKGRPQQLSAVVSNLLRNAVAAIDQGGRISLVSREETDSVTIEVRDNGKGIDSARLQTLFEPTLQVEGERVAAKNWGLFVCRSIVTEHGGQLHIESEPGEGTTARMSLPLG